MRDVLSALERNARDAGKCHRFLRSDGSETALSFAALWERSLRRAAGLAALGAGPGERVAISLQEPDAFVLTFFAALLAGAVPTPVAPAMAGRSTFFDRTRHVLDRARARFLVTDATTPAATRAKLQLAAAARPAGPLHIVDEAALEAAADGRAHAPVRAAPEALAFLQFTSGSTQRPKGVMVTHANLAASARVILAGMQVGEDDRGACWLPLFHDMGLLGFVIAPVFAGAQVVYSSTLRFGRKPTRWFDDIHSYRLTATLAPNFALGLVTDLASDAQIAAWDLSCLRVLGCGAEPIHARTVARFQARFAPCGLRPNVVLPSYGLAEATLAVTFGAVGAALRVDHPEAQRGEGAPAAIVSCGRPIGCELSIVDADGRELADGCIGEVVVRGASVSPGYFDDPSSSAATFGPRGLRTGDLGYLRDGELYVCGRLKELIILRGRNYYPSDLEQALAGIDARLLACAALALDAEEETRLAIVAEVSGGPTPPSGVIALIRRTLWEQHDLDVTAVVLVGPGQIPRTTSGKLQRRACAAALLAGELSIVCAHSRVALGRLPASAAAGAPELAETALQRGSELDERALRALLIEQLAQVLGRSHAELDQDRPFADFGLDSVKALRLTEALAERLARPLEPEIFWRFPSVAQLAAHLAPRAPRAASTARGRSAAERAPLSQLSERELANLLADELASLDGAAP